MTAVCTGRGAVRVSGWSNPFKIELIPRGFGRNKRITEYGIITSVRCDQSVIAQFAPTFGDSIFVTPFGDAPGTAIFEFLTSLNVCDPNNRRVSTESLLGFYAETRLRPSRQGQDLVPIRIAVNEQAWNGFLVGMQFKTEAERGFAAGALTFRIWDPK